MKAMLYTEVGGPEVLQFIDVPDPEPGAGDVIVDVAGQAITTRQGLEAALAKGDSRRGVLILIDRGGQKTFAILKD